VNRNEDIKTRQMRFTFDTQREYIALFNTMQGFRNCTIVIDEADSIFQIRDFSVPLINVFLGSRNNNVNMYFVGKRPFLLPIVIRSQADEYVIFGVNEERDIQYLSARLRQQFPKDPYKLERGEAIMFKDGEVPKLIHPPLFIPKGTVKETATL